MGEEIAPQAVYIAHPAGSSAWRDSTGLGRLMDTYAWHVIATRDQRTLCGIDASGGSQRRAWKGHSRRTSVSVVHQLLYHVAGGNLH